MQRRHWIAFATAACVAAAGCRGVTPAPPQSPPGSTEPDAPADPPDSATFGHGSPRPECRQAAATGRSAYYAAPQVVADGWGTPVRLAEPLTDACPNDAIEISRDGRVLYFFWSPTVNGSHAELLHAHTGTYRAERVGADPGVFGAPTYFELQQGVEGASVDAAPSFSPDGSRVWFHSTRSQNLGYRLAEPVDDYLDIYVAEITDGVPGVAVNLGEPLNSIHLDGEHGLHPDGRRLFLTSTRPGGIGGADIWVSEQTDTGWDVPRNLGSPVNSAHWDGQPGFVADDPALMYFVSDRDGPMSIYRTRYDGATWSEPEMVMSGYVGEPAPVGDGSILYFVHVLVDGDGVYGSDIWYVETDE